MWRRVIGPFREFGLRAGFLYALDRAMRSLSPRLGLFVYELIVQPITDKPMLPTGLARNLTFVEIGRDHPDVARMPAREDIKAQRFEQGARCLAAYRKGALVGYMWMSSNCYAEDEVRCTYHLTEPALSVFDFDLYVMPEHRLGIGFMAVWHGANRFLHERGVRYTFSRMTRFNLPSRRAHARLGGRCIGQAVFFQAWQVELMLSTLRPYVGLTWSETQRTQLHLAPDLSKPPAADVA